MTTKKIAAALILLVFITLVMLRLNPVPPCFRATILQKASEEGLYPVVALQLYLGVDPTGPDRTPLHAAIINGDTEMARLLISHGADINRPFASGEPDGPPLAWALRYRRTEIAKMLIDKGAHLGYQSCWGGYRLLHMAAELDDANIVKALLRRGSKVNGADHFGVTPLHTAALCGNVSVAKVLLGAGADASAKTIARGLLETHVRHNGRFHSLTIPVGSTPSDVAVLAGHRNVSKLLAGAQAVQSQDDN